MKIAVFGDSFADSFKQLWKDKDESWIQCIKEKGYDIRSFGLSGTSTWYSYRRFLDQLHNYTHIIFSYSSMHRIHVLPKGLERLSTYYSAEDVAKIYNSPIFHNLLPFEQELALSIVKHQRYIKDEVLDEFVCQNVFDTINQIAQSNSKVLVNILPFHGAGNHRKIDLTHRTGNCITGLVDVSQKEVPNLHKMGSIDTRCCHLSYENNQILADIVLESLHNPSNQVIDASTVDFVFSEEIDNRYYALAHEANTMINK